MSSYDCYFFFQAEDGIRARTVTGVQTCALPISVPASSRTRSRDRSPSRGPRRAPPVQQGEHRRDEHEGGDGGAQEATDDGPAQRRVLLATFTEPERHGHHADDHGERGHQDGAEPREAGLDGRRRRVSVLAEPLPGEGYEEDAIRGRDADAHDGSHQGGDVDRSPRQEP